MKKIIMWMFLLLTATVYVSAAEEVTKVTYFPVSYAGYYQANVANLEVGITTSEAGGRVGKDSLSGEPLNVTGKTNIKGELTLNNTSLVTVPGVDEVAFGDTPTKGAGSSVTFHNNLRLEGNATLKNLNTALLHVGELKFGTKSFPKCGATPDETGVGEGNNMHWVRLRLSDDPKKCTWHLACGKVPESYECTGEETVNTCAEMALQECGIENWDTEKYHHNISYNASYPNYRMGCTKLNRQLQSELPVEWRPRNVLFYETRTDWGTYGCKLPRPQLWRVEPIKYYWDFSESSSGKCSITCRLDRAPYNTNPFNDADGKRFPSYTSKQYPLQPVKQLSNGTTTTFSSPGMGTVRNTSAMDASGNFLSSTEGNYTIGECYIAYHCPEGYHDEQKNEPIYHKWYGGSKMMQYNKRVCMPDGGYKADGTPNGYPSGAYTGTDVCSTKNTNNPCSELIMPSSYSWCSGDKDCFGGPYPWSFFLNHTEKSACNRWTCFNPNADYAAKTSCQ